MWLALSAWGLLTAGPVNGADRPEGPDEMGRLLKVLGKRTVKGQAHRSLVGKYSPPGKKVAPLKFRGDFTDTEDLPIALSDFEEWPAPLLGALPYLTSPTYEELLGALAGIRGQRADRATVIGRIVIQSELWVLFDTLYLNGTSPQHEGKFDRPRWCRLLWEVAQTMLHLGPDPKEIEALASPDEALASLFGQGEYARSAEYWNVEQVFSHDFANGYRRSIHVRLFDPTVDFANLTKKQVLAFSKREQELSQGAWALLYENAIAITPNRELVATPVPLVAKPYRVVNDPKSRSPVEGDVFRINYKAKSLSKDAFERFPDDAEGWANVPLPNIPTGAQSRSRAPLRSYVCALCHLSASPVCFNPGYDLVHYSTHRVNSRSQHYTERRNLLLKSTQPEAVALWRYMRAKSLDELGQDEAMGGFVPLLPKSEESEVVETVQAQLPPPPSDDLPHPGEKTSFLGASLAYWGGAAVAVIAAFVVGCTWRRQNRIPL
jgi:hypothetical protein